MIGLERSLERWQESGLIDAATADRIRTHEKRRDRPTAAFAVGALGLLALALGMALIVGSNWERIPAPAKLGVHLAALLCAGMAVFDGLRRRRPWQAEGFLFLMTALVVAGIALQGQIYQQTAPIWQAMALWTALCVPALILAGSTWLTGAALTLMFGSLGLSLAAYGLSEHDNVRTVHVGLGATAPFALLMLAAIPDIPAQLSATLRAASLALMLGVASFAHLAWATNVPPEDARIAVQILALPFLGAIICLLLAGRGKERWTHPVPVSIAAAFLAAAAAVLVPHGTGVAWQILGAASFCAMWGAVGWSAAAGGWRFLFRIAVAAIAVRLFIVYFEVFGTLAATGAGLIVAGLLVLALLAGWRRIVALAPWAERVPR